MSDAHSETVTSENLEQSSSSRLYNMVTGSLSAIKYVGLDLPLGVIFFPFKKFFQLVDTSRLINDPSVDAKEDYFYNYLEGGTLDSVRKTFTTEESLQFEAMVAEHRQKAIKLRQDVDEKLGAVNGEFIALYNTAPKPRSFDEQVEKYNAIIENLQSIRDAIPTRFYKLEKLIAKNEQNFDLKKAMEEEKKAMEEEKRASDKKLEALDAILKGIKDLNKDVKNIKDYAPSAGPDQFKEEPVKEPVKEPEAKPKTEEKKELSFTVTFDGKNMRFSFDSDKQKEQSESPAPTPMPLPSLPAEAVGTFPEACIPFFLQPQHGTCRLDEDREYVPLGEM